MKKLLLPLLAGLLVAATAPRAGAVVISYSHDAAGRLTAATYGGATRLAYQYDRNGSLLARRAAPDVIPALAATYAGLVGEPLPGSLDTGIISLKLLPAGGFSGSLTLNGKKHTFRGTFNPDGTADPIAIGGMTLTLALDVSGGTESVTGTLTIGGDDAQIALSRAAFNAKTNPLPAGLAGKFTLLLGPTELGVVPQGDGYGAGAITAAGRVRAAVKLAENTGFTQSATLAGPAALWPFYANLYKKKGYALGFVTFDPEADVSDFSGDIQWVKPATTGTLHPAAFNTVLALIGSKYQPPARGRQPLALREAGPNAQLSLSGSVLPGGDVLQNLTLNARNQWVVTAPVTTVNLKLKTVPGTGVTTGSLRDGAATFKFGGVVFQKQNLVSGHVLGPTQSGPLEIAPQ